MNPDLVAGEPVAFEPGLPRQVVASAGVGGDSVEVGGPKNLSKAKRFHSAPLIILARAPRRPLANRAGECYLLRNIYGWREESAHHPPAPQAMAIDPENEDLALRSVETALLQICWANRQTPLELFGAVVRQAIDEVVDGPRTGRWLLRQLEKTEKTYIGTKIEIITRVELEMERAKPLDLEIEGYPVDIKWSERSSWMVPPENFGEMALVIGTNASETEINVGLAVCYPERLGAPNRDGKRPLTRASIDSNGRWLVRSGHLVPNFIATLDDEVRNRIMNAGAAQARITALAQIVKYRPIPRQALFTVAHGHKDVMRRLRADANDTLGGMILLNGKTRKGIIQALGLPAISGDEFISVPRAELIELGLWPR